MKNPKRLEKRRKRDSYKKSKPKKNLRKIDSPVPAIPKSNKTTIGGQIKKKAQDTSEITFYSCNKKGHFTSNYTKKTINWLQS